MIVQISLFISVFLYDFNLSDTLGTDGQSKALYLRQRAQVSNKQNTQCRQSNHQIALTRRALSAAISSARTSR